MMKNFCTGVVFLGLLFTINLTACGQSVVDQSAQRTAKIEANLKLQLPQLREVQMVMGALSPSEIPGYDRGSFVLNGQQQVEFIVSGDDTKLYIVAGGPFDVSRSSEAVEAALAEEAAAEAREAEQREEALMALVEGLPVRGNPDAPVTIIEFSDFQCPYCARGANTMATLLDRHPEDVRFIFAHFPLPNHPWARPAAIAAECVAQQDDDVFWALHDHYFDEQRAFTPENVLDRTRTFLQGKGIDLSTWAQCAMDDSSAQYQQAAARVDQLTQAGSQYGVSGTPGFFVNGEFISGAQPVEVFEALINQIKSDG